MLTMLLGLQLVLAEPKAIAAMVVEWSGTPTWTDGTTTRPVKMKDYLRPGETLRAGADGKVTLFFVHDGHTEIIHADATLEIGEKQGKPTGKVEVIPTKFKPVQREANDSGKIGGTQAILLEAFGSGKIGGAVLRGAKLEKFDPAIRPLNEVMVATDRPQFRWPAVEGAIAYRLTLETAGGKAVWTKESATTEYALPVTEKPLDRMKGYKWSVVAILPNKDEKVALKSSKFTVGTEEISKQAEALAKLAANPDTADQLLAAVGFEHLGLYDELYPLYAKITQAVPNDDVLLVTFATWAAKAGREKESNEAYAKAVKLGWKGQR